ncbi:MAG TPA: hypothetical protein VKP08_16430 [Anaerolineales bacterium]|nr:hypothetical protein [Anaerolineales bacterium]
MYPATQKYTVEDTGSALRFSSPYRKSWLLIFTLAGTVITACALVLASLLHAFAPETVSLLMALPLPFALALLLFGTLPLVELLWQLVGLEVAEVTESQITIKHQIFGIGISKNLYAQTIDGVFVSHQRNDWLVYMSRDIKFLDFKKGAVAINYGETLLGRVRTYRFGSILEKEAGTQIVELIHERFPQYKYHSRGKAG